MKRVFAVDALCCHRCGGRREVLAFMTEGVLIRAILECLGLPALAPTVHPARGSPELFWRVEGRVGRPESCPDMDREWGDVGRMGGFEIPVRIVIVLSRDRDPVIAGDDAELRQEGRALVAPPQDQLEKLRERLNLLA